MFVSLKKVTLQLVGELADRHLTMQRSFQNPGSLTGAVVLPGSSSCFGAGTVSAGAVVLREPVGQPCGVALLFVVGLHASSLPRGAVPTPAEGTSALGHIPTQGLTEVGLEHQIDNRVVKGGGLGKDSCQSESHGRHICWVTECCPHGHDGIWTPCCQETDANCHGQLYDKRMCVGDLVLRGHVLLHSLTGAPHGHQDECVGQKNDSAGHDVAEEEEADYVAHGRRALAGSMPIDAARCTVRLGSILPPARQRADSKNPSVAPDPGNQEAGVAIGELVTIVWAADFEPADAGEHSEVGQTAQAKQNAAKGVDHAGRPIEQPHVSKGRRYSQREEGHGHAEVTDGQVNHKKLGRLQGGLLSIGHEQQDAIPQHRQDTKDGVERSHEEVIVFRYSGHE